MFKIRDGITFIIQGKLHPNSINHIELYKQYGDVVVSTWTPCGGDETQLLRRALRSGACVVTSNPTIRGYNRQNVMRQCVTTLAGLRKVDTELFIKLRTDEYYTKWDTFIETIINNPNCITTNNVFFRPDCDAKFHPSDHVVGGKTATFRKVFSTIFKKLREYEEWLYLYPPHFFAERDWRIPFKPGKWTTDGCIGAEQCIMMSFLRTIGVKIHPSDSLNIMREYCRCVNVRDMGEFRVGSNGAGLYTSDWEELCYTYNSIMDMGDTFEKGY